MERLRGKLAIVTGAAQGIGKAIALALADRGAVVVCLDKNKEENDAVAALIMAKGGHGISLSCDVSDPVSVSQVFGRIFREYGPAYALVNNAAVFSTMSFVQDDFKKALEDFDCNMNCNARGAFLCAKMVAPQMAAKKSGQIINVVTNHVKRRLFPASANEHSYDASKFAQLALNESMAQELKEYGIRVNAICPAATRSPMLQNFFDDIGMELTTENIEACTGYPSLLECEEVGEAVCHMLEWSNDQPVGKAYLVMYSEDCEKLKYGHVEELAK